MDERKSLFPSRLLNRDLAEEQSRTHWFCYGCASRLAPGEGRVQKRRNRDYYGLYCKSNCPWPT